MQFVWFSFTVQCLFAPSESSHLIAGYPSKLWDKLIQHTHDDHCSTRARTTGQCTGPTKAALLFSTVLVRIARGRLDVDRPASLKA